MESRPNPDSATNHSRSSPVWLLLGLVIVAGAVLRLYGLDVQSLWNDELSSWAQSNYATLADVIELGVRNDVHPPGYQLTLYYVIHAYRRLRDRAAAALGDRGRARDRGHLRAGPPAVLAAVRR